jgi:hypothetical protein
MDGDQAFLTLQGAQEGVDRHEVRYEHGLLRGATHTLDDAGAPADERLFEPVPAPPLKRFEPAASCIARDPMRGELRSPYP